MKLEIGKWQKLMIQSEDGNITFKIGVVVNTRDSGVKFIVPDVDNKVFRMYHVPYDGHLPIAEAQYAKTFGPDELDEYIRTEVRDVDMIDPECGLAWYQSDMKQLSHS